MKIYKEYDSLYIFERNDIKLILFAFMAFLETIAHSFGVPVWFKRPMTPSIVLRGMTKNSSFLRIRAIFVSYCPLFWGSGVIYTKYDIS
jgi:hypothetical protein